MMAWPENIARRNEAEELSSAGYGEDEEKVGRGDEIDRSCGANRWPCEETLALLRVRSDMDAAFRDSSLKAPLWEEVSRKLAEVGFQRTPKKCKEKFENIYKYHKRTREGRSGRPNGKNYRFFQHLEVFDSQHQPSFSLENNPPPSLPPAAASPMAVPRATPTAAPPSPPPLIAEPINAYQGSKGASIPRTQLNTNEQLAPATSTSTASTSSAREESEGSGRNRKRRKLSGVFKKLMKEVIEKQENLQKQFIEAIERCENERRVREEAWKMQELAKIQRDQEILAQERAIAAAKDAAVIAFLQKISGKGGLPEMDMMNVNVSVNPKPHSAVKYTPIATKIHHGNGGGNGNSACNQQLIVTSTSSRWPKEEVEALIRLRTEMEMQYQENGPKGPLWEDISGRMQKLGFDRSAKRCKEKWENINKYFKRVKDSNRKRPQDSKTCPYFHLLDAIYKERSIDGCNLNKEGQLNHNSNSYNVASAPSSGYPDNGNEEDPMLKPEELLMQMVGSSGGHQKETSKLADSENTGALKREDTEDGDDDDDDDGDDDDDDDDEEEEEEEEGEGGYQVVANNSSMAVMG